MDRVDGFVQDLQSFLFAVQKDAVTSNLVRAFHHGQWAVRSKKYWIQQGGVHAYHVCTCVPPSSN